MKSTALHRIATGETAVVESLHVPEELRRRLLDIGLTEGTNVTCLGHSPFGDPSAYQIRGAVIAIRRADGEKIKVRR